jgi:hypothetical protein
MLTHFKKVSPTIRFLPGMCPCGAPAVITIWEADLLLCSDHAREWLRSPEKVEAGLTIEIGAGDDSLREVIDSFVERIRYKPTIWERIVMWWRS